MKFWDRITGNDITREFKAFENRVIALPREYQLAWEKIEENIWQHSDFTGRNLIPILDSALTMLEETSADGLSIQDVLGNDIEGFCFALIGEDKSNTFRDKWRRQLNNNIKKKLGK